MTMYLIADMWGVGVIAYLLVSGGVSPFWGGNRYRTMAKTLSCDYTMDLPNFEHISHHGKDFISKLLVLDPKVGIRLDRPQYSPRNVEDVCRVVWILESWFDFGHLL